MEPLDLKTIAVIVNAVGNLAIGAWLYLDRKGDRTNARIDEVGARVTALDEHVADKLEAQGGRLAHLEAHAEEAPSHTDIGAIYDQIRIVDSKVSTQGGKLDGIESTLRMILSRITEKGMS